jgi:NAD(P)-dependent dehydrogenase (short-subunit alcohol dehydrogenase family)
MTLPLSGRCILVTGSGRGLGKAYAQAAARAGAKVFVNDVDADVAEASCEEIRAGGGVAEWSSHAVDDAEAAQDLVRQCSERLGSLDGLVNNAGRFIYADSLDTDFAAAETLIRTNLLGALHCGVAAMRAMQGRDGVIINALSGAMLGMTGLSIYGASKGGLQTLTAVWAKEAPPGVTVIGISPRADTRMTRAKLGHGEGGPPDAIAPLAVYLLSPAAKGLHGRVVRLAEGVLALLEPATFRPISTHTGAWSLEEIANALAPHANPPQRA